jgi:SNF2 family DNA or RNA helicase
MHGYQVAANAWMQKFPRCQLFLDMGLGKTVSTLTAFHDLKFREFEAMKMLVVAPKRVAENVWTSEVKKWSHLQNLRVSRIAGTPRQRLKALWADADVYTLGRDNMQWFQQLEARPKFEMLVLDESSSFKNHKAKRFKAIRRIMHEFDRAVLLTGTPMPKGLIDLWAQMFIVDAGERLERTITKYRDLYFHPGMTNGHVVYNYVANKGSEEAIHDKLSDIAMSMKSEDYLQLPPRTDVKVGLTMPPKLKRAYKEFAKEQVMALGDVDIMALNAAGLSNKLCQFANGAVYDEDMKVHEIHDLKLEALEEIVEPGNPVLVAWTYKHDRDRILERFAKHKPRQLKTEQDIEDWNAGKISMLLMHPASGGHGLNLQAGGNIIVWFGQTWSLELYQQLNARLMRQGQKRAVFIHHLIIKGSIEEKIMKSLDGKNRGQESLMAAVKAVVEEYR